SEQNQLADRIKTYLPEQFKNTRADLLLANILAGPLHQLASQFAELLPSGGQIVLSGLLENQAADIIETYSSWFDIQLYRQQQEWICLHGQRH
ncbi:MAG: 50S ribosomal protein L11 methyltransferase, partial [Gammaproteobacteria bacterium]|nr:50S ribosomal protein L11 methyltransferase [Gammaproteobacteria bacterium]